jgi:hypothetical protein
MSREINPRALPPDEPVITEAERAQQLLQAENRELRQQVRTLQSAVRSAGKIRQPYANGDAKE